MELAHTLTTSSAIMALQRLAARHGSPAVMYSDNGTNSRGALCVIGEKFMKKSNILRLEKDMDMR